MLVSSLWGELECIERAGGCAEVPLGQMQVDGSYFEVAMPEQNLDSAQVGSGLKKVCGEAMPQGVGMGMCLCARPARSAAYEGPDDVHVVGRNASKTKPAKFVVFFVKDKGAPILVPAN